MGKSGGGKKKKSGGGGTNKVTTDSSKPNVNGGNTSDTQILFLKRAQELKEEGTKKYQAGDYAGALERYSKGLKLVPDDHPNRAVFHSNRAACLLQINPIDYEEVISECSLALKIQPGFTRALLRRAKAFEALGKVDLAVEDVNEVLKAEPNHKEAMEMSRQQLASSTKDDVKKNHTDCSSCCSEETEGKMDDWIHDFAELFRTRLRIDPEAHVDIHDLAVDRCNEALEETLTSEEAQPLFEEAAGKFQQVAALALLDWGKVLILAAEKRNLLEESTVTGEAYEWVKQRYIMGKEKYEQALSIKPEFYDGLRDLGVVNLEIAKLQCSFAVQQKIILSVWEDSTEVLNLFQSAEEKIKAATEMLEKKEENKKEASEMLMIWGNILYERSQLECETGVQGWEKNLESALERYRLAGVSESDISVSLENHCSNQAASAKGDEKEEGN
ncbi:hypothetical protein AALP_AA1G120700 [Arabis alpina]|uniref:Uncharacterized protein n=1 Tax=Arabis alpina TaxID=50452 RepID=A0A087HMP4_ARAAL|nr:hypothetical protein AALP_AA1G120700 [Arabis alpina]